MRSTGLWRATVLPIGAGKESAGGGSAGATMRAFIGPSLVTPTGGRRSNGLGRRSARVASSLRQLMSMMGGPDELTRWIEQNAGAGRVVSSSGRGGSSWASSKAVETESGRKFFIKTSPRSADDMFTGEAEGLRAMHATNTVLVPDVLHYGDLEEGSGSFIIMDYLDIRGGYSQAELGRQLAQMHLSEPAAPEARDGKFGFVVNNTIGGTPQPNEWTEDYVEFFREKRLRYQFRLARDSTLSSLGDKLMNNLESYFEGIDVKPCILHGDLWSGNVGGVGGKPTIFDPACYYGHSEAEFGMSWCAGFNREFWKAYFDVIPKAPGFEERKQIYLLYHYLNHYNLFGGGYYSSCVSILQNLVG
mmetsp:Transcript_3873/g.11569  ORF Transcript_3873/g.11569 Transcript_3873/m.11569 type:complete len:360 (-) Transcript_3873:259-1338(-)